MWRRIKRQLRLEDEDSTRTDLVLVGNRWFAMQLRVLDPLTSPTALAVIVLLRNAFDLDFEQGSVSLIAIVWLCASLVSLEFLTLTLILGDSPFRYAISVFARALVFALMFAAFTSDGLNWM